jgi:hypothetical protein
MAKKQKVTAVGGLTLLPLGMLAIPLRLPRPGYASI